MNLLISKIFGGVLNVMHVVVAIVMVLVFLTSAKETTVYILLGASIGYICFVGVACTLIAIRENLETLIKVAKE